MTLSAVQGRPLHRGDTIDVLLSWIDTNENSYTITVTEYRLDDPGNPTTRTISLASPDDLLLLDDELASTTDRVTYLITNDDDAETGTVTVELTGLGYTYPDPDHTASTVRYTTLADVKQRLGTPTADTGRDDDITAAILAAEAWIDVHCDQAFDSLTTDTANPRWGGIPNSVKRAALLLSTAFYVDPDLDPLEADMQSDRDAARAVQLLYGYRRTGGYGIA